MDLIKKKAELDASVKWTHKEAIGVCKLFEQHAVEFGAHVALSGGLLYKEGDRKDCDIVFYRHRQVPLLEKHGLLARLQERCGLHVRDDFGFVVKATYLGKQVDLLFPEVSSDLDDYSDELVQS